LAKYMKLSRFAPKLILDEEFKTERFHDGLSPQIRERIAFLENADYFKMMHTTTIVEKRD
jgi:hypothetical protein